MKNRSLFWILCVLVASTLVVVGVRLNKSRSDVSGREAESSVRPDHGKQIILGDKPVGAESQADDARSSASSTKPGTGAAAPRKNVEVAIPPHDAGVRIHNLVREELILRRTNLVDLGRQLMTSTNQFERRSGFALLAETKTLTQQDIDDMAKAGDLSELLGAIAWLHDTDRHEEAQQLLEALDVSRLMSAYSSGDIALSGLDGASGRILLDLVCDQLSPEKRLADLKQAAFDEKLSYDVRMKALVLLQDLVSRDEYAALLKNESGRDGSAKEWKEGVAKLLEAKGLEEDADSQPSILTLESIDMCLAAENRGMFEDMALKIEYVLAHSNWTVEAGSSVKLIDHVKAYEKMPWDDDQKLSLRRLISLIQPLMHREQASAKLVTGTEP